MIPEKVTKYYELLSKWLAYYGFSPVTVHAEAGIDLVFKRSRFEASKFGNVDAYCCVKYFEKPSFLKFLRVLICFLLITGVTTVCAAEKTFCWSCE